MTAPLAGVVLVALEQAVAGPMCTRTLADLGARVIKIENPDGGDFTRHYDDVVNGLAAHFVWVNRGKESVALDLKDPRGLDALHRLLDRADVLVSNLAPGATTRLGLDPATLAQQHPRLFTLEIDGYGPGGPLSSKRAYDLLVQAESGACSITGTPGAPAKPGPPMADVCTGLYGAITILAALNGRSVPGQGRALTVSMFDTMTELMGYALNHALHTGVDTEPVGMGSPAVAPYGAYATRDGKQVVVGTTNDREWQRLTEMMGRPDLGTDPRYTRNADRVQHREELDRAVSAWCAAHELAEIQDAADQAGIGNARYNTATEVVHHPHLQARDRWREIDSPAGRLPVLLPPPAIAGYEPRLGAVPGLGEHTAAVLAEVGLDGETIDALTKARP